MSNYQLKHSEQSGRGAPRVQIVREGVSREEAERVMNYFAISLMGTWGQRGVSFRVHPEADFLGAYEALTITYRPRGYEKQIYRIWIEKEESND